MLYYKIIKNDIRKSKLITVLTMLFVVTAAMLVSLAAILLVSLFGSVDTLMNQAKTPHYMQMHAGEIDRERLASFAEQNKNVEGTAILLVTHDAKVAARSERVLFMSDGRIMSELQLAKSSGNDIDFRSQKVTAAMREIGI